MHLKPPAFKKLKKNNYYSFYSLCSGQNKGENKRTVTAVVDIGLSFLILSTNVDNVVLFIKSAKVRRFYVYMFTNNASIVKI